MACPEVLLSPPVGDTVTFDCETEDPDLNVWIWNKLTGWYEPPTPTHSTLPLGGVHGDLVTKSEWQPRQITVEATCLTGGEDGRVNLALDTLTRLTNMLLTAGQIQVNDNLPKYATVFLSDRPTHVVIGRAFSVEVQIPLVAYDVYRYAVADDVGYL